MSGFQNPFKIDAAVAGRPGAIVFSDEGAFSRFHLSVFPFAGARASLAPFPHMIDPTRPRARACFGARRPAIVGGMTKVATISLHRSEAGHAEACAVLCAEIALSQQVAPDWIQILPAGDVIETQDGRGPYTLKDANAVIEASMNDGPLPVDQDHATDLAAPKGLPAPARGWIVELEARGGSAGGVWGRVEWTEEGARMVAAREYRGVSPVFLHTKRGGGIVRILRASLVNSPNLRGLAALHSETKAMDFMKMLREALGLAEDADEDAILDAVRKTKTDMEAAQASRDDARAALQTAEGARDKANDALKALQASGGDAEKTIAALQSELSDTANKLNALIETTSSEKATVFVDGAIKAGRVGVKPMRDKYIAMHMKNPKDTEELINAMPILGPSGAAIEPPADAGGATSLNAAQRNAAKLLGVSEEAYLKTLQAEQEEEAV